MSSSDQITVILPAAGSSSRFGRNKLLEKLGGQTVIARSVEAFLHREDVSGVVIVTSDEAAIRAGLGGLARDGRVTFIAGGSCRAASCLAGVKAAPAGTEWIALHDAARPLVDDALIDRVFQAALLHGAAAPALPVSLTIKQATGPLPAKVQRTIPRDCLWAMQTPQIMRRADLLAAYETCPIPLEQITDDVQLLELQGREVWLVQGDERNLKLTTALDLEFADRLIRPTKP